MKYDAYYSDYEQTEHQINETLQRDYSELNKEYSEQVANYSLLETKYNTLESSLKTHFYQSKAQDQEDHQQESNVQTITNYINEIQKLENVFNSKLNDYNQKEQQWVSILDIHESSVIENKRRRIYQQI